MRVGRAASVALVGLLLALTVAAMGPHHRPGPDPITTPCRYLVRQGPTQHVVTPVEDPMGVVSFYDYRKRSAHTPFVEAYASVMFLYRDTTKNRMYFVFHFNIGGGGSPDAETDLYLWPIPRGAFVILSDDPFQGGWPEFFFWRWPQGQFHYFSTTDGGVLGPMPQSKNWTMKAKFVHGGADPMQTQKWVNGDGTRLPLAISGTIEIESDCGNLPPIARAGGPYAGVEGSPVMFDASGSVDPDGDPLTYTWDFEDDGADDLTTTSPIAWHTYPDDFGGFARLTVSDGLDEDVTRVEVSIANHVPIVTLESLATPSPEGARAVLAVRVTDPGADWVDLAVDWGDGTPVEPLAPVFAPSGLLVTAEHAWGDDGAYAVSVLARDDDGGEHRLEGLFGVAENAPPTVSIQTVSRPGALGLRLAGEKWHDAVATFFQDGTPIASLRVERAPGSPDDQMAWTPALDLAPASRFTATVAYTPEDDPVNGQPNGASPAWIVIAAPQQEPVVLHHTFNAGRPETHAWDVDFTAAIARLGLVFEGLAVDPGSDDLTFEWDFGDGSPRVTTFYNDGSGPDPASSPLGTFPFAAADIARRAFGGPGTYLVVLTVTDDDGGVARATVTVTIAG